MTPIELVKAEQNRARDMHNNENNAITDWYAILLEEIGEFMIEYCKSNEKGSLTDNFKTELVQVAAMCLSMMEDMDEREMSFK